MLSPVGIYLQDDERNDEEGGEERDISDHQDVMNDVELVSNPIYLQQHFTLIKRNKHRNPLLECNYCKDPKVTIWKWPNARKHLIEVHKISTMQSPSKKQKQSGPVDEFRKHYKLLFIREKLPFNFTESLYLRKAFQAYHIAATEIGSEEGLIPGRTCLSDSIMNHCHVLWNEDLTNIKMNGTRYSLTLTFDGRTNINNQPLIVFLIEGYKTHIIERVINCGATCKNSDFIVSIIHEILKKDYSTDIICVTSDAAPNCLGALAQLKACNLITIRCVCHLLNLSLSYIFKYIDKCANIKTDVENLVCFVRRHSVLNNSLKERTGGKTLLRHCPTRFCSIFYCFENLICIFNEVKSLFSDSRIKNRFIGDDLVKYNQFHSLVVLNDNFESNLRQIIPIIQPIVLELKKYDKEDIEVGSIYPSLITLRNVIKKTNGSMFTKDIAENSAKYIEILRKQGHSELFSAAFLLSPLNRNKILQIETSNKEQEKKRWVKLNDELLIIFQTICKRLKFPEVAVDIAKKEFDDYLVNLSIISLPSSNISFWCYSKYTYLATFAKKILCVQVTTSNVERVHKSNGEIHDAKRNGLSDSSVEALMKCHYILLEREKKGLISTLDTSKPKLNNEEYHDDQGVAWFEPNELFPKLPDDELIEAQYNVEFEGLTQ